MSLVGGVNTIGDATKLSCLVVLKREVDWIDFRLSGKLFHMRLPLYFNDLFPNVVHGVDI